MINSITIQNILSHKKTHLEFSPGVTMLIGPSGAGKSAILNTLNWIFTLRPSGDEHRSWNGGKMIGSVELDTGEIISLEKDKQSIFKLTDKQKQTKTFKAFGQNVPQDIKEILNIDPKINIQKQLDKKAPMFLLSEPPGDVAKFFNKVAGLYKIDETQAKGKSDVRETEQEIKNLKSQIENKRLELEKYKGLGPLHTKVLKARKIENLVTKMGRLKDELKSLLFKIQNIKDDLYIMEKKTEIKDKVNHAINQFKNIKETEFDKFKISTLLNDIDATEYEVELMTKKQKILPKINTGINLFKIIDELKDEKTNIRTLFENGIKRTERIIDEKEIKLKEQKEWFNNNFPDECPLCGR